MNYHIIEAGESLWSIAQEHGCNLAELLAANPQITNPNNISVGTKIFLPENMSEDSKGDENAADDRNGSKIPQFGTTRLKELDTGVGLNKVSEDCRQEMCSELRNLPRPLIYVVKKDDNIYQLAKCFDISMKELLQVNPQIKNPDMIYPGDKIFVPRSRVSINMNTLNSLTENGVRYCPTCGSKLS